MKIGTRLEAGLRQRLRVYAAITGRTCEDVVGAALRCYLPRVLAEAAAGSPDLDSPDCGQRTVNALRPAELEGRN